MLVYTHYLHDNRDAANPRSGLTTGDSQKICAQQNCARKERGLAILGIMGVGGFLRQRKSESDSLINHCEPTLKFMKIVEGGNSRILQIIDTVGFDGGLAEMYRANPSMGRAMRTGRAEGLLAGWKLLAPFPEFDHFVSRDGG